MTTILTNAVFSKKVTAQAEDENYNYKVDYEVAENGKKLVSINVQVTKKSDGSYAGNLSYQNSSKNISGVPDAVDASALVTMLDSIIAEVQSTLAV